MNTINIDLGSYSIDDISNSESFNLTLDSNISVQSIVDDIASIVNNNTINSNIITKFNFSATRGNITGELQIISPSTIGITHNQDDENNILYSLYGNFILPLDDRLYRVSYDFDLNYYNNEEYSNALFILKALILPAE